MKGIDRWLERAAVVPKNTTTLNFTDHHKAVVRCMSCDAVCVAVYPQNVNPNRLMCGECGAKDSQVVKYLKYYYKQ